MLTFRYMWNYVDIKVPGSNPEQIEYVTAKLFNRKHRISEIFTKTKVGYLRKRKWGISIKAAFEVLYTDYV